MRAALAVDFPALESSGEALSASGRGPRPFMDEEIDPLATLIGRLDQEIDRRDLRLDEPFALVVSCRSSIPLALCGTKSVQRCDQSHAGRCRRACRPRFREWRAELDAANSGPDGGGRYELSYRVRWTSDWYFDDLATLTRAANLR
jgi:hypothetical protein